MYDQQLNDILTAAVLRLNAEMEQAAPFMAASVSSWMKQLSGTAHPEDYFRNPIAFPLVLLPWWLEKTIHLTPALPFQSDLAYSTVNGYYYIRLLDNLIDGHTTVELELLPAAAFFHTQFQAVYQRYFEYDHPFWGFFTRAWLGSAEATMKDAHLEDLDAEQFRHVASKKVCAGKIPLAAVCYRYGRPDLIEPWSGFCDLLGGWHQMWNDVFDWSRDLKYRTRTYFLSEAERRQRPGEGAAAWVVREGFDWGVTTLQMWMKDLRESARPLNSPDLDTYLDGREAMLLQQRDNVAEGLRGLAQLAAVLP